MKIIVLIIESGPERKPQPPLQCQVYSKTNEAIILVTRDRLGMRILFLTQLLSTRVVIMKNGIT